MPSKRPLYALLFVACGIGVWASAVQYSSKAAPPPRPPDPLVFTIVVECDDPSYALAKIPALWADASKRFALEHIEIVSLTVTHRAPDQFGRTQPTTEYCFTVRRPDPAENFTLKHWQMDDLKHLEDGKWKITGINGFKMMEVRPSHDAP